MSAPDIVYLSDVASNGSHVYLSTSCLHGHHAYCQTDVGIAGLKTPAKCKFCPSPCVCQCHKEAA